MSGSEERSKREARVRPGISLTPTPWKCALPRDLRRGSRTGCAFRILVRSEMIDVFVALGQRAFDGVPCPSWRFWLRFDLCSGLARSSKPKFWCFATSCSSSSASAPEGESTFRALTTVSGRTSRCSSCCPTDRELLRTQSLKGPSTSARPKNTRVGQTARSMGGLGGRHHGAADTHLGRDRPYGERLGPWFAQVRISVSPPTS